jgi:hypothetical protein
VLDDVFIPEKVFTKPVHQVNHTPGITLWLVAVVKNFHPERVGDRPIMAVS